MHWPVPVFGYVVMWPLWGWRQCGLCEGDGSVASVRVKAVWPLRGWRQCGLCEGEGSVASVRVKAVWPLWGWRPRGLCEGALWGWRQRGLCEGEGSVASVRVKAVWPLWGWRQRGLCEGEGSVGGQSSLSQPCGLCEGEGSVASVRVKAAWPLWGWRQCGLCEGEGRVASVMVKAAWPLWGWRQCGLCEGEGSVGGQTSLSQPCGLCEGEGGVASVRVKAVWPLWGWRQCGRPDQPQSAMWPLWGWRWCGRPDHGASVRTWVISVIQLSIHLNDRYRSPYSILQWRDHVITHSYNQECCTPATMTIHLSLCRVVRFTENTKKRDGHFAQMHMSHVYLIIHSWSHMLWVHIYIYHGNVQLNCGWMAHESRSLGTNSLLYNIEAPACRDNASLEMTIYSTCLIHAIELVCTDQNTLNWRSLKWTCTHNKSLYSWWYLPNHLLCTWVN